MRRSVWVAVLAMLLSLVLTQVVRAADLVTTYGTAEQPFAVVSDPLTGRVYVSNSGRREPSGGGLVIAFDPATHTAATLATTKTSNLLAIDGAARRLYSSNAGLSPTTGTSVDVFDLDSGARLQSFDGIGGLGVALDDSRHKLYASSASFLVSLDTNTFDMNVRSAPFGQSWFGVAVDRALGRVYATNISFPNPSLVVLNSSLQIIGNVALPTSARFALAVDEATHRVFVGGNSQDNTTWTVSVVDGTTFALNTVSFNRFPNGIVHEPSMHRIWVTSTGNGATGQQSLLTALDDETLAVQSETTLPWQPGLAAFGRDGLLYVAGTSAAQLGAFNVNEPMNVPPVIDGVGVSPLPARTNDTLVAAVSAHDADGDPLTTAYQWTVNGQVLATETSASLDLSQPGRGDRGDTICLTVTVSDGHEHSATWSNCFGVADSGPVASVVLDSAAPATDAVLHASATASDVDGDVLGYEFTWRVNGVTVRTASGTSASDQLDLAQPGAGNAGDTVSVSVVVSDGTLSSAQASANVVVANSAPTVSLSLSDLRPWKHDLLVASAIASDRDGQALTFTFTWRVNGATTLTASSTSATSSVDLDEFPVDNRSTVTVDVVVSDGTATASASATATITTPGH